MTALTQFESALYYHSSRVYALHRPSIESVQEMLKNEFPHIEFVEVSERESEDDKAGTRTFKPIKWTEEINWVTYGFSPFSGKLCCFAS